MFGYGLVGILRPLTVYPSEMVYWMVCLMPLHLYHVKTQSRFRTYLPLPLIKVYDSACRRTRIATIDMWLSPVLHSDTAANYKRVRLFWIAFCAMFIFEIFPAYIFPLLNGFSIFCLASQRASPSVQDIMTNLFGGAGGNEGLGVLSLSFDWQYIGSALVPCACYFSIHIEHTPSTDT